MDTKLVLSLAPLFSCTNNQIYIKFTESLRDDTPFNLLPHEKDTIQITSINDMLRLDQQLYTKHFLLNNDVDIINLD